jgi:hypothetical protein
MRSRAKVGANSRQSRGAFRANAIGFPWELIRIVSALLSHCFLGRSREFCCIAKSENIEPGQPVRAVGRDPLPCIRIVFSLLFTIAIAEMLQCETPHVERPALLAGRK